MALPLRGEGRWRSRCRPMPGNFVLLQGVDDAASHDAGNDAQYGSGCGVNQCRKLLSLSSSGGWWSDRDVVRCRALALALRKWSTRRRPMLGNRASPPGVESAVMPDAVRRLLSYACGRHWRNLEWKRSCFMLIQPVSPFFQHCELSFNLFQHCFTSRNGHVSC